MKVYTVKFSCRSRNGMIGQRDDEELLVVARFPEEAIRKGKRAVRKMFKRRDPQCEGALLHLVVDVP